MKRRTFLGFLVAGGAAVGAGVVAIPTFIAGLSPVWQARRASWRPLGLITKFPPGKVHRSAVVADRDRWPRSSGSRDVFVWRKSDSELIVFSRSCTDLGCPLDYDSGSGCYLCPCHGGIFDRHGRRLAGPPKSPMYRYAHRIRDDILEIDVTSVPPAA